MNDIAAGVERHVQPNWGFRVLLLGPTGTGKTHSIRTLVEAGLVPYVISTEPGISSVLGDIPSEKLHWKYIPPAVAGWDVMLSNAKKIHTLSFKALSGLEQIDRQNYGQFLEVVTTCANFVCDRDGISYGSVDSWGTDRVLVVDSLTGLSKMAMNLVVGAKPTKNQGEWGVAMDNLERLMDRWTCGIPCHFIMTGHLEREKDEVTGAIKNFPSTLGTKLPPKVPLLYDDVIMTKRQGTDFYWTIEDPNTDLKTRHLGMTGKFPPSFGPVFEAWKRQGNVVLPTVPQTTTAA